MWSISSEFTPITLNTPNNEWKIPLTINVKINKNFNNLNDYLFNTLKGISMTEVDAENYKNLGKPIYTVVITEQNGVKIKFYLREKASLMSVFDFLMYMKVSLTNFNISNGVTTLMGDQIICDGNVQTRIWNQLAGEDLKKADEFYNSSAYKYWDDTHVNSTSKIKDNFEPFVFMDEGKSLFSLAPCVGNPYGRGTFEGYIPCVESIGNEFVQKNIEISFSKIDFNKTLISFFFNDIRTLDELSKITQYKVSPIIK
jgi:hypothetical protein